MARWEWVRWVGSTRSESTRAKRVDVSIDKLRHGSRRPCCFDLSSCTDPELMKNGELIAPEDAAQYIAGLILLVAMIGAILLTLRHRRDVKRQDVLQQMWRDPAKAMRMTNPKPGQGL